MKLKAPREYDLLSEKERKELLNQCGPDGPLNSLVPDHLLGLSVAASCNRHDFMFAKAKSARDFQQADQIFLENMMTQIEESESHWLLKTARKGMAYLYFAAVRIYSRAHLSTPQSNEKQSHK